MDILGFPLIRRHTTKKHKSADLQQCLIHEPGGSSRAATYSSGHKRRSTGTAAPTRTRARAHASTSSQQTRPAHPSFIFHTVQLH